MLLLWPKHLCRDQLRVFVHPQQLVLIRRSSGLKKSVIAKQVIPTKGDALSTGMEAWQSTLDHLKLALVDQRWQGADVEVVISNHLVRYAIIPWRNQIKHDRERQAYLKHCFIEGFGESAQGWNLQLSESGFGKPAIASGMSNEMLLSVRKCFEGAGIKLRNLFPQVVIAINPVLNKIGKRSIWFCMIESGRIFLAMIHQGQWQAIYNQIAETDISAQICALIHRESVISGLTGQQWPILLYWPEARSQQPLRLPDHEITMLNTLHTDAYDGNWAIDQIGKWA